MAAQADLMRGEDGLDKPLSCPGPLIARLAAAGPEQLPRLLDERRMERFGARFLEILRDG
jgi:ATP-dependent DNA helicase RecQ